MTKKNDLFNWSKPCKHKIMSISFYIVTYSSKIIYEITHQQKKTQHWYYCFVKILDKKSIINHLPLFMSLWLRVFFMV